MYKAPYPYQNINNTNLPTSCEREITTENVDGPHLNIESASKYTNIHAYEFW